MSFVRNFGLWWIDQAFKEIDTLTTGIFINNEIYDQVKGKNLGNFPFKYHALYYL